MYHSMLLLEFIFPFNDTQLPDFCDESLYKYWWTTQFITLVGFPSGTVLCAWASGDAEGADGTALVVARLQVSNRVLSAWLWPSYTVCTPMFGCRNSAVSKIFVSVDTVCRESQLIMVALPALTVSTYTKSQNFKKSQVLVFSRLFIRDNPSALQHSMSACYEWCVSCEGKFAHYWDLYICFLTSANIGWNRHTIPESSFTRPNILIKTIFVSIWILLK